MAGVAAGAAGASALSSVAACFGRRRPPSSPGAALAVVALEAGVAARAAATLLRRVRRGAVDDDGDAGVDERAEDLLGLSRSHLGGLDRLHDLGRRDLPARALRVGDQGLGERANVGTGLVGFCHE